MKAIRFMAPETIEVSDIPMPVCKDDEVIAKIAYAGFCATDIELLTGEMVHIKNGNTTYPLVPGHEWAGTIVAVGSKVRLGRQPGLRRVRLLPRGTLQSVPQP